MSNVELARQAVHARERMLEAWDYWLRAYPENKRRATAEYESAVDVYREACSAVFAPGSAAWVVFAGEVYPATIAGEPQVYEFPVDCACKAANVFRFNPLDNLFPASMLAEATAEAQRVRNLYGR